MAAVGAWRRERYPADPYKVLASLPLPVFITTNADNLLADALSAEGKHPQVEFCRWKASLTGLPSIYETEPAYQPDISRPLVFQFFGQIKEPDSLVITEDDYFDYLIGVTRSTPGELVPPKVGRALTNTALLFLGFQLDDWDFRVFFRSIMSKEGKEALSPYAHVAVQIDPEGSQIVEPAGARRYLERYFQVSNISIYWGSVEDFVDDLASRWQGYLLTKQGT